jgi:hypothetical protein
MVRALSRWRKRMAVDESVSGFSRPGPVQPETRVKMKRGRPKNKRNRQEGTLLRPPEPKAARSNRALPIPKSFRGPNLPDWFTPAGGAGVVTV